MKDLTNIKGTAIYKDIEYPFLYIDKILYLCPGSKEIILKNKSDFFDSFQKLSNFKITHEWIPNEYIKAKNANGYDIVFYTKGEASNSDGFLLFDVQVVFEFYDENITTTAFEMITIESEELDLLFSPGRLFDINWDLDDKGKLKDVLLRTEFKKNPDVELGSYRYKDIDISLKMSIVVSNSFRSSTPIKATTCLKLAFSRNIDFMEVQEVINHTNCFLMYISYRQNVNIRSIKCYKNNTKQINGEIHILNINNNLENHKKKNDRILQFATIENIINALFQGIADKKIYLEHISKSIEDRNSINVSKIVLYFAAFEREYGIYYKKSSTRSEPYFGVMNEMISLIKEMKKTEKSKSKSKYYNEFIRKISYDPISFAEKIKYAININKDILDPFLRFEYQSSDIETINSLSERMNLMRNSIAHGNLGFKIEPIHLSDIRVLQVLIFSIRLSNLDIQHEKIINDLKKLFGINFLNH